MIFEVKGDLDFFIILVDNSCLMCDFILFIIDGGILWYFCLNGDLFDKLI